MSGFVLFPSGLYFRSSCLDCTDIKTRLQELWEIINVLKEYKKILEKYKKALDFLFGLTIVRLKTIICDFATKRLMYGIISFVKSFR